ncbi:UNVERIFIED_CONTAM: hypothetical protein NCL1_35465 [Trichonephila clavipes]
MTRKPKVRECNVLNIETKLEILTRLVRGESGASLAQFYNVDMHGIICSQMWKVNTSMTTSGRRLPTLSNRSQGFKNTMKKMQKPGWHVMQKVVDFEC